MLAKVFFEMIQKFKEISKEAIDEPIVYDIEELNALDKYVKNIHNNSTSDELNKNKLLEEKSEYQKTHPWIEKHND